jgi:hypothetical protein
VVRDTSTSLKLHFGTVDAFGLKKGVRIGGRPSALVRSQIWGLGDYAAGSTSIGPGDPTIGLAISRHRHVDGHFEGRPQHEQTE